MPSTLTSNARFLAGTAAGFLAVVLGASELTGRLGWDAIHPTGRPGHAERILAYTLREGREDVLLIGSSRVGGGVNAWTIDERLAAASGGEDSFYKLSLPGIRPRILAEVLEGPVSRRPPEALLVIAVETRFFCKPEELDADGQVGTYTLQRDRQREPEIEGEWLADSAGGGDVELFDGLRSLWVGSWALRDEVRSRAADEAARLGEYREPGAKREHLVTAKRKVRNLAKDNLVLPEGFGWAWTPPDGPDAIGWQRVMDAVAELPCETLFIRMPLVEGFDADHMAAAHSRFEREIVAGIRSAGHEYLDLNRPPYPRSRRYYTGLTHLDWDGAKITSELLADEVLAPRLAAER